MTYYEYKEIVINEYYESEKDDRVNKYVESVLSGEGHLLKRESPLSD
jgi:hypothetical protein